MAYGISCVSVGCCVCLLAARDGAGQAPGKAADAAQHVYKSPQEVGDAFSRAMAKRDWKTGFQCFAPEDRDLVDVHLIYMSSFVARGPQEKSLQKLFVKHGFDAAKASTAMRKFDATALEKKKPDSRALRELVRVYAADIKDKEAFFVEILGWFQKNYGQFFFRAEPTKLKELKTTGDTASAKLVAEGDSGWTVHFRRIDGAWYLTFPDHYYAPTGWNDVFLYSYLDALHEWSL